MCTNRCIYVTILFRYTNVCTFVKLLHIYECMYIYKFYLDLYTYIQQSSDKLNVFERAISTCSICTYANNRTISNGSRNSCNIGLRTQEGYKGLVSHLYVLILGDREG